MKYIDADKLIAEIERLQQEVRNKWKENPRSSIDDGFLTACSRFLGIVNSLQQEQPEVDLKKEIDKYFALWRQGASDEGCVNADSQFVSIYDCYRIARHFFELGLKARKEE